MASDLLTLVTARVIKGLPRCRKKPCKSAELWGELCIPYRVSGIWVWKQISLWTPALYGSLILFQWKLTLMKLLTWLLPDQALFGCCCPLLAPTPSWPLNPFLKGTALEGNITRWPGPMWPNMIITWWFLPSSCLLWKLKTAVYKLFMEVFSS